MSLPFDAPPAAPDRQAALDFNFSKLQDFSSILRDISLNVPASQEGSTKSSQPQLDQSHNSSLGLLPAEAMSGMMDNSTTSMYRQNISLGRYLQPAQESLASQSEPLSDSDEEENFPPQSFTVPQTETLEHFKTPFLVPSVPQTPNNQVHLSNNSAWGPSGGFPWDKIVNGDTSTDISSFQKHDLSTLSDSWHQGYQDPSFCSGKFSARSTSFGGENNTRDENFSDFATVPSFQGSFASQHTNSNAVDSIFQGGSQLGAEVFPGFDAAAQAELGIEFGDQEFGSLGKDQLKCFLDQEEAECLQANPFIEEEQCEEPADSSVFSGVSDKSIMLRNSNLWGGDTSQVNLSQLKMENNLLTKVSRCEYFRHNSSRLGSLEDSVAESDRPGLGFVHNIRSPERRPCALLSETVSGTPESQAVSLASTFSMEQEKSKDIEGRTSEDGSSDSAPSSANTTYIQSGNSTKTVVSMMDQSGTLKAAELASRLQTLADQLGGGQALSVSYPDVVEDSISSNLATEGQLEASIRESFGPGSDINLSTISKVLSDASVSSDPQHFVNVLLGCLRQREQGAAHSDQPALAVGLEESQPGAQSDSLASPNELPANTPDSSAQGSYTSTTPATLPRTSKSNYSNSRLSHQSHKPNSAMTPTVSKRAMLRLTPSSEEPHSTDGTGVGPRSGTSKPIKPFGTINSTPVVLPVKPQLSAKPIASQTPSAPNTARNTHTPSLSKTSTLPSSINTSNRTRRLSGARHSSPIKKVVTIQTPPEDLVSTPLNDLSTLLTSANTPSLHLASSSHITTSTPYHHGLNLSTVILDHLTHNQSVSPFVNPDTSISAANLDVSTINPTLYTSLVKPVRHSPASHQELHLPPHSAIELPSDWTPNSVYSSHTKVMVSVPVKHNLTSSTSMVMKVTSLWVGSCQVPHQHWNQLVDTKWEKVVNLDQNINSLDMDLIMKKAGTFTFNIGVMLENGVSSCGLVRLQVEEPNIQVLTESGSKLDFGCLPEDCSTTVPLILVNCGSCPLPIFLEIKQPADLFSFTDGSKFTTFSIPGVVEKQADGKGVAKEIELQVKTEGVSVMQPQVFQTELLVMLGEKEKVVLGAVDIMVKVGTAKLRVKKSVEPVLFSCVPGESITQSIQLRNCGNVSLMLETMIEETNQGSFTCKKNIQLMPDCDFSVPVTFTCSPQARFTTSEHKLYMSVMPNGPKHLISLQTLVMSNQESINEFKSSRPALSFGVIKKPDIYNSSPKSINNDSLPAVFPVESDRSLINFFNVSVGMKEEQIITLKNSTFDTVCLNLIIRETDNFFLLVPAGPVSTSQLVLPPQTTQDVKILYCPTRVGMDKGKLVLKPQRRKVGGKSIKASINLCGVSGNSNIQMEGVEELEPNHYQLPCQNGSNVIRFMNKGDSTGFVKIACGGGYVGSSKLEIIPSVFLLESGFAKDVYISCPEEECSMGTTLISIFSGPELVRQVMKRARQLPGAVRLSNNPTLMGIDFEEDFPGEEMLNTREPFSGELTALDVKHFYKKTLKHQLSLTMPSRPLEFDQLSVEDTLSETRIDQSIAMPLSTPKVTQQSFARHGNNFHSSRFPTQANSNVFPPVMSKPPPTLDSQLLLIPNHLSLTPGGESIVKLVNKSSHPVHWDMSWPSSKLSISPGAGQLSPHGQAVVCVQAVPGQASWRGQVSVYSDNSVDTMEVVITAAATSPCILVSSNQVEMGMAVLGSTTTGSILLTNPGQELVQWMAQVTPSFFSLPQCAGLLNPSQSISLPLIFKPAASGSQSASLSITANRVRGGMDQQDPSGPPAIVNISGTAVAMTEVLPTQPNPIKSAAKLQPKKSSGTVSLESELVIFPDTVLGETSVSKVKIKNRSGSDQAVEILPLPSSSPFRTVHSVLEVKNQCYCTVPVQFRPMDRGDHNTCLTFMWEGNMVRATLTGKGV